MKRETGLEPATACFEERLSPVGLFSPFSQVISLGRFVAGFVWQPMPPHLTTGAPFRRFEIPRRDLSFRSPNRTIHRSRHDWFIVAAGHGPSQGAVSGAIGYTGLSGIAFGPPARLSPQVFPSDFLFLPSVCKR